MHISLVPAVSPTVTVVEPVFSYEQLYVKESQAAVVRKSGAFHTPTPGCS
jgi:hypothetical protein